MPVSSCTLKGFTLIELMITLSIAAILLVLAAPSFETIIQNNRAVTLTNNFVTSLQLARGEAIKRGQTVSVCAASTTTQTACGNATHWNNGWIVFVDDNNDGVIANTADRLYLQQAPAAGTTIVTTQSRISFASTGFVASGAGSIVLAATGCSGTHARTLSVANTGRISVAHTNCP
ncbi:MAG: GspH/FimT family pseudopilin [Gammaproteobacteria bacterium]